MNICTSEDENDFSLAMNILENEKAKQNEKISESNIYSSSKITSSPNQNNMADPSIKELKENIHNLKKNSSNLEIIDYPFIQNKSPSELKLKVESNLTCMNHETELMIEYINNYKSLHDNLLKNIQDNIEQKINYRKYLFDNYNFEKIIKQEKENKNCNDKKEKHNNIKQKNRDSINNYSGNTFIIDNDLEYPKSEDNNLNNKKNNLDNNNNNGNENNHYLKISNFQKQFDSKKIGPFKDLNNKKTIKKGKNLNKKDGKRNLSLIIKMVITKKNFPWKFKNKGYISKNDKNTSESSINYDLNNYSKDTEISKERENIIKNKNENINYNIIANVINNKGKIIQPIKYSNDKTKGIPTGRKKKRNSTNKNNITREKINEKGKLNQIDFNENRNSFKIINKANTLKINKEIQQIPKIKKVKKSINDNSNINYNNLKHIKNSFNNTNNNIGKLNNKKSKSEKILNGNQIRKENLANLANYLNSSSILKTKISNYKVLTNSKYAKRGNTNSKTYCKSYDKKYKFEKNKSEVESKNIEEKDKIRNLTISYTNKILNKRKINNINKKYMTCSDANCKSAKNINKIRFNNYFKLKINKIPNKKIKLKRDSFVNNRFLKYYNNPTYLNYKTYNANNSFLQSHKENNLKRIKSKDIKNKQKIKNKNNSKIPHNFNKTQFTLGIHNSESNFDFINNIYSINYKTNYNRLNTFNNKKENKQNRKNLSSTTIFHSNTIGILNILRQKKFKNSL